MLRSGSATFTGDMRLQRPTGNMPMRECSSMDHHLSITSSIMDLMRDTLTLAECLELVNALVDIRFVSHVTCVSSG